MAINTCPSELPSPAAAEIWLMLSALWFEFDTDRDLADA